eukprot:g18625.t1
MTYTWPVTRIVKALVEEKEERTQQGLMMMGTPYNAIWISWFLTYAILLGFAAILITIISAKRLFPNSDPSLTFLLFWMAALSIFAFCYFISCFFSRARPAILVGALVYLVTGLVTSIMNPKGEQRKLFALMPTSALVQGGISLASWEGVGLGVTWENYDELYDGWSVQLSLNWLLFDTFLYFMLGLYVNAVWPKQYGVSEKAYFCCTFDFWRRTCGTKSVKQRKAQQYGERNGTGLDPANADLPNSELEDDAIVEKVAPELEGTELVQLRNLRKVFKEGVPGQEVVAVKGLNLDMYAGQILVLLGHNGAGKTTTINMLTGFYPPSEGGECNVYGHSIFTDMSLIRNYLGVCPQHDILYPLLTVEEHLHMFARLKGIPRHQRKEAVDRMIAQVGLTEKVQAKAATLSGGMKRKLSIAMALIGDSKVVFLDEPTSGMDPYSRRSTWDLLQQAKKGRVIVLTTHFMDEADYLGDRIAIMGQGRLICCGSSLFLKNKYGVGYNMTVVRSPQSTPETQEQLDRLVKQAVPEASVLSDVAAEITYRLPFQASPKFEALFNQMDEDTAGLGIQSYGVSVTTLEEVFLKVGNDEEAQTAEDKAQTRRLSQELEHTRRLSLELAAARESKRVLEAARAERSPSLVGPEDANYDSKDGVTTADGAPADGGKQQLNGGAATDDGVPTKVANGGNNDAPKEALQPDNEDLDPPEPMQLSFLGWSWLHFKALFIKRFHNGKRDRWTMFLTILLPVFLYGLLMGLNQREISRPPPPTVMDTAAYRTPTIFTYNKGTGSYTAPPEVTSFFQPWSSDSSIELRTSVATNSTSMDKYLLDSIVNTARTRYGAMTFTYQPVPIGNNSNGDDINSFVFVGGSDIYTGNMFPWNKQSNNAYSSLSWLNGTLQQLVINFNSTARDSLPVYLNQFNNLRLHKHNTGLPNSISITTRAQAFPTTFGEQIVFTSFTAMFLLFALAFLPMNYAPYIVRERKDKVLHQQLLSGVRSLPYWLSNWCWDFCNSLITLTLIVFIVLIIDVDALVRDMGGFILVLLMYAVAMPWQTYALSLIFVNPFTSMLVVFLINVFTGPILLIVHVVLLQIPKTQKLARTTLVYIWRVFFPSFCLGDSVYNMYIRESAAGGFKKLFDMDITGWDLLLLFLAIPLYGSIVFTVEYVWRTPGLLKMCTRSPKVDSKPFEDDPDIIKEAQRIDAGQADDDIVKISHLRKVYPGRLGGDPKIAVHDLSFGIPAGQCFGFLGINGAGKTTTLQMLTADTSPSDGEAWLSGWDIMHDQSQIRRLMGYCPQFDALIGNLTARETLFLYARIKGLPEDKIAAYATRIIKKLTLEEYADKPCQGYSGGNKRKLSVGMALIGNPKILFLDEPSTGMDPKSRRFMWQLIAATMTGRSVILTTHSMEEAEALCGRLGIMVGGRLRCLGSAQHLKHRYGDGYQLDLNTTETMIEALEAWLHQNFVDVVPLEKHGQNVKYRVSKKLSLGRMFGLLETVKEQFAISAYSLSETSLEQIFIHFARQQEEEKGSVAGLIPEQPKANKPEKKEKPPQAGPPPIILSCPDGHRFGIAAGTAAGAVLACPTCKVHVTYQPSQPASSDTNGPAEPSPAATDPAGAAATDPAGTAATDPAGAAATAPAAETPAVADAAMGVAG